MSDKFFDDFLKQSLQQNSDYIDDDNFTARVMANLPGTPRLNPWLEKLIIAAPVTLIALFVLSQLPWRDFVRPAYGWYLTADPYTLLPAIAGTILLAVIAPLVWVLRKSPAI